MTPAPPVELGAERAPVEPGPRGQSERFEESVGGAVGSETSELPVALITDRLDQRDLMSDRALTSTGSISGRFAGQAIARTFSVVESVLVASVEFSASDLP